MFLKRQRLYTERIYLTAATRIILHDLLYSPEKPFILQREVDQGTIVFSYRGGQFVKLDGIRPQNINQANCNIYHPIWSKIYFRGFLLLHHRFPVLQSVTVSNCATFSVINNSSSETIKEQDLLFAHFEEGNSDWVLKPLDTAQTNLYPVNNQTCWKHLAQLKDFWLAYWEETIAEFITRKHGLKFYDNAPIRAICEKLGFLEYPDWSLEQFLREIPPSERLRLHESSGDIWTPSVAQDRLTLLKVLIVHKIYTNLKSTDTPEFIKFYCEIFPWILPFVESVAIKRVKPRLSLCFERVFCSLCPFYQFKSNEIFSELDQILRSFCGIPRMSAKPGQPFVCHVFPTARLSHNLK